MRNAKASLNRLLKNRFRESGVNVIGQVASQSGQGQIARGVLSSLTAVGYPVAAVSASPYDPARADHTELAKYQHGAPFDINVFQASANHTSSLRALIGPGIYAGRYNVGYWAWELAEFPDEWTSAFDAYDEIWVFSEFARQAISRKSPIPVTTMPVPIEVPPPDPGIRGKLGLPEDAFLVMFVFDANSVIARKNPWAVIRAFKQAFDGDEHVDANRSRPPRLVIKVNNLDIYPTEAARLRYEMTDVGGVLLEGYLPGNQTHELIGTADLYISLHRSEGFGLTIAEAMAMGRPTVATAYSANVEFMTEESSYLIPYQLVPLEDDIAVYRKGNVWAEADIEAAARVLRHVYDNPEEAERKGHAAAEYMRENHNRETVGRRIAARARDIKKAVRHDGYQPRHPALVPDARLQTLTRRLRHWHRGVPATFEPIKDVLCAVHDGQPSWQATGNDPSFQLRFDGPTDIPAGAYRIYLQIGPETGRWGQLRIYPDSGLGYREAEAEVIPSSRESQSTISANFYLPKQTTALRIDPGDEPQKLPVVTSAVLQRIADPAEWCRLPKKWEN